MDVDLSELLDDVHRGRRVVVAIGVVSLALLAGTLVGPVLGGVAASGLAPLAGVGVSDRTLTGAVVVGSLAFSLPISVFLLAVSVVWHLRVRRAFQAMGVERPAVGILEPARFVAVPVAIGAALSAAAVPLALWVPAPPSGSVWAVIVTGAMLISVFLGPLLGLYVGLRRGIDRAATARFEADALTLDEVPDDGRSFPLIARTSRAVIRAELLRRAGRLDEADALLRAHTLRSGVGPYQILLAWARVHRDAGRIGQAEQSLAAAARLVSVDLSALRLLADLRRDAGRADDAHRIDEAVTALRAGNFGLELGGPRRSRAA